jgi:hypothetical protein
MSPSDLVTVWSAPDNSRLTPKQFSFRLPTHVAAKLAALEKMFRAGRVLSLSEISSRRHWSKWRRRSPVKKGA